MVGSADVFHPPRGSDPHEFDWEVGPNRRDELLGQFFDEGEHVVRSAKVNVGGNFDLILSKGLVLAVFVDNSLDREQWRIFKPYSEEPHFVSFGGRVGRG